jgi:endonuclease/exonuclease/phosphatase family metal-dependent hydrolase
MPRRDRLRRAILAVLALGLASAPVCSRADDRTAAFSMLSYNVHGLFRMIAGDTPGTRSRTIGWLASRYDVAVLQEDFEYHGMIARQMHGMAMYRGNGMRPDPRLVAAKAILFPFQLLIPHFSPPYGAGLTTFVRDGLLPEKAIVARRRYDACNGWFTGTHDCWASKGLLRVRMQLPNGAEVDVYNTHLEAGDGRRSQAVRKRQLDDLARHIEDLSPDRAVIAAGDFNCAFSRPGDGDLLMAFRNRVGLQDSGAGPEIPFWRERDYVLYRDGAGVRLIVGEAGEATEFVNDGRALSDHPAIFARFEVVQTP